METITKANRNQAYKQKQTTITKNRRIVLDVIKVHGPITNKEIAEFLGWNINQVTGRTSELQLMGYIKVGVNGLNVSTDCRNVAWVWVRDEAERRELNEQHYRELKEFEETLETDIADRPMYEMTKDVLRKELKKVRNKLRFVMGVDVREE